MILDDIVRTKRQEIRRHRAERSLGELERRSLWSTPRRGFAAALARGSRAVIAEVKKASPSRGVIRADFDPVALGETLESAGARALSVLTDEPYFQGKLVYLEAIRQRVGLPLLRKDFVVDPYQVAEARAFGADAVLLICACLEDRLLRELLRAAKEQGLDALVEVHTADELERALGAGAGLIGINNRDLRTFETRLEVAEELAGRLPQGIVGVAESGLRTAADLTRLERSGIHAFLIGESLMEAADPGARLGEFLETA